VYVGTVDRAVFAGSNLSLKLNPSIVRRSSGICRFIEG
jgi:hypothetical protein